MKPKLLYVTRQWPAFTGGGTPMRMGITLQALARYYAVHLLLVPDSTRIRRTVLPAEIERLCAAVDEVPADVPPDPAYANVFPDSSPEERLAAERASPRTFHTSRSTPEMVSRVVAAYPHVRFEAILVNRIYMAPYVEPLLRATGDRPYRILDLDDIESRTHARIADTCRLTGFPIREEMNRIASAKYAVLERNLLPLFDEVWVCSHDDREFVVNAFSHGGVRVVPNAVRLPTATPPKPPADMSTLLFVGLMGYFPNEDAAVWLCREILAVLRQRSARPLRVVLAGKRPGPAVLDLARDPDVAVLGEVEDLSPFYRDADIVAVPIRAGGGTRIKILEAMGYRRPVVSTTMGAEGFELTDGVEIKLADSALEFASACLALLDDPATARAIVDRAHSWLLKRHTPEVVREAIRAGRATSGPTQV